MKKIGEYKIYSVFLLLILAVLIFEVLHSGESDEPQLAIIDIPRVDHMYIDFPCNVFVTKSEEETIVFEGHGKLVKQVLMNEHGKVLHLSDGKAQLTTMFNKIMLSEQTRPNLYIRICDPSKIIPNDKLTVISSEPLSQYRSGFLSSLKTLKELITSRLQVS